MTYPHISDLRVKHTVTWHMKYRNSGARRGVIARQINMFPQQQTHDTTIQVHVAARQHGTFYAIHGKVA
jgi:hypothetical protein